MLKLYYLKSNNKNVIANINNYFEKNEMNYRVVKIFRKTNHKDDWYLYVVIAKNTVTGKYTVWTSWNETMQSLSYGHYGIQLIEDCLEIVDEYTNVYEKMIEIDEIMGKGKRIEK